MAPERKATSRFAVFSSMLLGATFALGASLRIMIRYARRLQVGIRIYRGHLYFRASWGIKFASTGLRVLEVEDLGFRVSWGLEREVL